MWETGAGGPFLRDLSLPRTGAAKKMYIHDLPEN